jgi:hypothetical protein
MRSRLDGWYTLETRRADGAIDSAQRVLATRALVEPSRDGARRLGRGYWSAVTRASLGLVVCRESADGAALHLLGFRPALLTFAPARLTADAETVTCAYEITGGLLARQAGGSLVLTQRSGERTELHVEVEGFFPRLGVLYGPVERRFHILVSRRYLARLIAEGRP